MRLARMLPSATSLVEDAPHPEAGDGRCVSVSAQVRQFLLDL